MSHVFHQLYYHFIWGTHARTEIIAWQRRPQLLEILHDEVKNRGGTPIRHNAMPDHVPLFVELPPTAQMSEFIGRVKGAASYRFNKEAKPQVKLRWQEGFGVLTLRGDEVPKVSRYIDNQEDHHRHGNLSELLERLMADEESP